MRFNRIVSARRTDKGTRFCLVSWGDGRMDLDLPGNVTFRNVTADEYFFFLRAF